MCDRESKPPLPPAGTPYPGPPPVRSSAPSPANAGDDPYAGIAAEDDPWIRRACAEAVASVADGGGPFGAVLVQIDDETGRVLRHWIGRNRVTLTHDPTEHAEIHAIRAATRDLGVVHLSGIAREVARRPQTGATSHCVLYSSTEPCPMCYGALAWARIPVLVFAATRYDAEEGGLGFLDRALHDAVALPYRNRPDVVVRRAETPEATAAFAAWRDAEGVAY
ncbi:nucleoside deaminase [Roseospira marina]|uniref:nucleoside deaminase n=1 Tax=Roseospira marina TaxID=140057 RepID=UPI0017F4D270|nr:nucleoside deaminase [Roseospira marina]MBB4314733.1 tRNA(Arg) A34 adenosine deaminase TadA [Roseospira marina]